MGIVRGGPQGIEWTRLPQQRQLAEAGALADARQLCAVALVVDRKAALLDHVEVVTCEGRL
jgi:hypothetical protein